LGGVVEVVVPVYSDEGSFGSGERTVELEQGEGFGRFVVVLRPRLLGPVGVERVQPEKLVGGLDLIGCGGQIFGDDEFGSGVDGLF
jgi:hypothetical protein